MRECLMILMNLMIENNHLGNLETITLPFILILMFLTPAALSCMLLPTLNLLLIRTDVREMLDSILSRT
jgi:hypothetical protein